MSAVFGNKNVPVVSAVPLITVQPSYLQPEGSTGIIKPGIGAPELLSINQTPLFSSAIVDVVGVASKYFPVAERKSFPIASICPTVNEALAPENSPASILIPDGPASGSGMGSMVNTNFVAAISCVLSILNTEGAVLPEGVTRNFPVLIAAPFTMIQPSYRAFGPTSFNPVKLSSSISVEEFEFRETRFSLVISSDISFMQEVPMIERASIAAPNFRCFI